MMMMMMTMICGGDWLVCRHNHSHQQQQHKLTCAHLHTCSLRERGCTERFVHLCVCVR